MALFFAGLLTAGATAEILSATLGGEAVSGGRDASTIDVAEDVYARVAVAPRALDLGVERGWLGLPIVREMRPVLLPIEIGRLPRERREG